jgi:hypothetical protein
MSEMALLYIENIFEHNNIAQMEYYSVHNLKNNFIDILCIYTYSPAASSTIQKRFQKYLCNTHGFAL